MSQIKQFHGRCSTDAELTAIYMEEPSARIALGLVFLGNELPRIVHWGRPISQPETLIHALDALKPQRVSGALDETPWPSVLPTQSESWVGESRLALRRGGVELFPKVVVTDIETDCGGDASSYTSMVMVRARDVELGVEIVWYVELMPSGLVRQKATIHNLWGPEAAPLEVGKVELGFPLPACATEILSTTGHHLRERSPQRQPLTVGRFEKTQISGRPDFDASLLLNVGVPGFGFEHGQVYSVHVGWSGNSVLGAERLPYTQGLVGGGELLFGGEVMVQGIGDHNETMSRTGATDLTGNSEMGGHLPNSYDTPWVFGAYGDGLNEVSARFHDYVRTRRPQLFVKPRPVTLNTWEAVYYNQGFDTLKALVDVSADIGVERFVVDDGWFGARRDETKGLGDWQVARDVWPQGTKSLSSLANYVHSKAMEFGLWFEPEMANPDSDMVRSHPDWLLAPTAKRLPMPGRSQQVVDLTNPEAYNYVIQAMDRLIAELGIDYIKWDNNRFIVEAVSRSTGRPTVHWQTKAVYGIFRHLKRLHTGLEIESCASGGGRIDLGILEYADRVWVSDCVDPVERSDIQRYTSLLVPPAMMGEHVGASPAHSTQRATSQELRMASTFLGHLGIEWNLLEVQPPALAKLKGWVHAFKNYRKDFAQAMSVHGDAPDPSVRVDGMVSPDGLHGIYSFTQLTTSQTYPAAPVTLPGLDSERTYRLRPLEQSLDLSVIGNGQSSLGWWTRGGITISGAALAGYGIRPPSLHPAQAVLFEALAVSQQVWTRAG